MCVCSSHHTQHTQQKSSRIWILVEEDTLHSLFFIYNQVFLCKTEKTKYTLSESISKFMMGLKRNFKKTEYACMENKEPYVLFRMGG